MRDHWRREGPPVNVALVAIAASLGIDLIADEEPQASAIVDDRIARPSIAELAQMMTVAAGHDTRAASRLIAERWKEAGDGEQ